jgi:putative ABC transport system ATP-binding protein
MELITALNHERGIAVVIVTHETAMADFADRVVSFVDGRVDSEIPREVS